MGFIALGVEHISVSTLNIFLCNCSVSMVYTHVHAWICLIVLSLLLATYIVCLSCQLVSMGCQMRQKATHMLLTTFFSGCIGLYTYSICHMHVADAISI